jgi:hypothetical protein
LHLYRDNREGLIRQIQVLKAELAEKEQLERDLQRQISRERVLIDYVLRLQADLVATRRSARGESLEVPLAALGYVAILGVLAFLLVRLLAYCG